MNKTVFEAIESLSVVDAVVSQIEELIVAGVLKSGQKLPSERELAEQLSVSRPKVRDAIKLLEDRGLLLVKHGDGTFVSALTGTALSPAMIDLFQSHPEAFGGYLEFRREVEGFAAYLASQRATEADRDIIRGIADAMSAAHKQADRSQELALDVKLHSAIVDATHNPMLVHVMASIYELMKRGILAGRGFQTSQGISRDRLLEQHLKIAEAILARDAEAASAAAEDHITFVENSFREQSTESVRTRIARKRRLLLDLPRGETTRAKRRAQA